PTGKTCALLDGAATIATPTLSSGTVTFNLSTLSVGAHSLTAVYPGDGTHGGSTSSVVTHTVNQAGTTTSLASAPNPSTFGESVTLTASVTLDPPGPESPSGTVEFFDGASSLGSAPVSAGSAQLSTSSLTVGVHSLTAHYSGDSSFDPSTSAPYVLEVKAKIVATAGPNGTIAPSGTTLYSLNATPSFTFAADPGYHVASV